MRDQGPRRGPRDRQWLRSFLTLDARAGQGKPIPASDVARQEDTVLRALDILDHQPGVVLADEVGMGKTYEALGVLAATFQQAEGRRALVLTPGPDLNQKWLKEFTAFGDERQPMYRGFRGRFTAAARLGELVAALRRDAIVIAPISAFASGRAARDQSYLLSLWCEHHGLRGNQTAAVYRQYDPTLERVDPRGAWFLDTFRWGEIEPHVAPVLQEHLAAAGQLLAARFQQEGYLAFQQTALVDRTLADLRFRLSGALIPPLHLLVIDEAHKLKNPEGLRATGVRTTLSGRFDKALFLTATPFQLSVEELRQVFALFALARGAPGDLLDQADRLLAEVQQYQAAYNDFERVWSRLDETATASFAQLFAADPGLGTAPAEPGLRVAVEQARRLLSLKRERIEPGFRAWMIRSLREDKREYRRPLRERLGAAGGCGVPFILYERFIAELFRTRSRTHKAAVQINMVSSFGAAREGALLADGPHAGLAAGAAAYRELLREILKDLRDEHGGHPKLRRVVQDALDTAERGDKTLIFCSRIATLRELRREIDQAWMDRLVERWRRVYPDATAETIFDRHDVEGGRGRHSRVRDRFHRSQDALYLALRERYVQTLLEAAPQALERLEEIVGLANQVLARQAVVGSRAERQDWALLKRCVEHAAALTLRSGGLSEAECGEALGRLCDPRYVGLGYDLEADELEPDGGGEHAPQWRITAEDARLVLDPAPHLWSYLRGPLLDVPPELRVRTVERLARYLTHRQVPFMPDLLAAASAAGVNVESIESRALLRFVDGFWITPAGRPWCDLLRRFLLYVNGLDTARSREILDGVVSAGELVRHTEDGESRERLREAFNTPLYPMVLVANEVMQEGLDLHHHCAHVVHHDLTWNPAQLEQRVGRVDRLGALIHARRERERPAPRAKLDILMPLIAQTIDERLERTVRLRERWLEFLLGAPPDLAEHGLEDEPPPELPPAFAQALRVELGP